MLFNLHLHSGEATVRAAQIEKIATDIRESIRGWEALVTTTPLCFIAGVGDFNYQESSEDKFYPLAAVPDSCWGDSRVPDPLSDLGDASSDGEWDDLPLAEACSRAERREEKNDLGAVFSRSDG